MSNAPQGYNGHDYNALRRFLELRDEKGVSNGSKLNPDYSPRDPATWSMRGEVEWIKENDELHLYSVHYANSDLVGTIDLSDCTSLYFLSFEGNRLNEVNVSGCKALWSLCADGNALSTLNVRGCKALCGLFVSDNALTSLDVSDNDLLEYLWCKDNALETLDISHCAALNELSCGGNRLIKLSTTGCALNCDCDVSSEACGSVWLCFGASLPCTAYANPSAGYAFSGWYDASGSLVSIESEYVVSKSRCALTARFSKIG